MAQAGAAFFVAARAYFRQTSLGRMEVTLLRMSDSWTPREHSAKQQGSVIPKGWHPTKDAPVPVVRCEAIKKDGEQCGRWSVRGLLKCASHLRGAHRNLENVANRTQATIDAARLRLVDDADLAIDQLEDLMRPGTAEAVRLKASLEVLDRIGIKGGFEVSVDVTDHGPDPAAQVRERLARLNPAPAEIEPAEEDIQDAEVIEDTLF